ncbi:MAG: aromatic ring-hydroxylating dioxygenase subunit alpha [Actinobacteria bacterium]|nr:aromatic ring-hydroxylating dioxygenase subunit alpha [Actinomycetota bacterium]
MAMVEDKLSVDAPVESPIGVSTYRYPTGWYVVGWSSELGSGQLQKLHYFGRELVCFRGTSGAVSVMDAYCLHLGGHLGVGGHVEGDDVVCPWHGWHWGTDGANTLIPYSEKETCKQNLRIRTYPAEEWCGMIVVWFDRDGQGPCWQLPRVPELETGEYYPMHPHSRMVNRVKVHPQMIVENAADPYHIQFVHHGDRPAQVRSFELHEHYLHATVQVNYGGGKPATWLTPKGPVDGLVVYDTYGIGIGFVRFPKEILASVQITGHTPVDDEYTDYFFAMATAREEGDINDEPSERAKRWISMQQRIVKQDFFTWENMKYLDKPNFAVEEAKNYAALRRWARRFYPPDAGEGDSSADCLKSR